MSLGVIAVVVAAGAAYVALTRAGTGSTTAGAKVDLASQHTNDYQVGVVFAPKAKTTVATISYYDDGSGGIHGASLWSVKDHQLLASGALSGVVTKGWKTAKLGKTVTLKPGKWYVASFLSDHFPVTDPAQLGQIPANFTQNARLRGVLINRGPGFPTQWTKLKAPPVLPVFGATTAPTPTPTATPTAKPTPTPTPTAPSSGAFPSASNTGVPAGTALTDYSGSCTITKAGTVISGKTVNCALLIKAADVVIKDSKINGGVNSDADTNSASVTVEDSEVNGGTAEMPAISSHNVTVLRSNVHGGEHSVQCNNSCTVKDSWLHGQYVPPSEGWHLNAFISNGGQNMTLVHNTLQCDATITKEDGGCTADASIFGDFEGNSHYTFDNNLFVASENLSYCAYGGYDPGKQYGSQVSYISFTNNVFQRGKNGKCGLYGPVTSFNSSKTGMVWTNNKWDNGGIVDPS